MVASDIRARFFSQNREMRRNVSAKGFVAISFIVGFLCGRR